MSIRDSLHAAVIKAIERWDSYGAARPDLSAMIIDAILADKHLVVTANRPHHFMNADGYCHAGDVFDQGSPFIALYALDTEDFPRVITTVEELNALPVEVVFKDNHAAVFEKCHRGFLAVGGEEFLSADAAALPALVIWHPTIDGTTLC